MMSDQATQSRHGPLSGVTVLDFTALVPGPTAGLMLTEAGAEVIKIEPPGGEGMRAPPAAWAICRRCSRSSIAASARSRST